jgi:hypothetical protein
MNDFDELESNIRDRSVQPTTMEYATLRAAVEMTEEYTVSFCSVEKILRVSGMCLSRNE